jgi:hypothetical protein
VAGRLNANRKTLSQHHQQQEKEEEERKHEMARG